MAAKSITEENADTSDNFHFDGFRSLPTSYAREIPIIALTANIFPDDIIKAMESGINKYLANPIDLHKVQQILNKWFVLIFVYYATFIIIFQILKDLLYKLIFHLLYCTILFF